MRKPIENNLDNRRFVRKERMPWPTYHYIRSLLEDQQRKLERDYLTACSFIPNEYRDDGKTPLQVAHDIFSKQYAELEQMKNDLGEALKDHYKDHPNKEMREFWGVED